MTTTEVQLVKASWKVFRPINPVIIGDVFYSRLFFKHPHLKMLFKNSKEEQAKKLIDMLNMLVGRLEKIDTISDDIAALAVRHVHYGVKTQHYTAVGEALLWTLQQGLGSAWTTETAKAWQACFTQLADAMMSEAYT